MSLTDKLKAVQKEINKRVFERKEETDGILLSVLSDSSCLFIGDVGTAKTYQIKMAAQLLGLSFFDILLSETSKPDHIFGPTDIPALAKGRQVTKIDGYAPTADIIFFDEIFKANAVVLNPLLWLINEKEYRNGDDGIIKCPTLATFAASNEIPTDPILRAIYDRLILRFEVEYLKDDANIKRMILSNLNKSSKIEPIMTKEDIKLLRRRVKKVEVPSEIQDAVISVRERIQTACNIKISDRRLAKAFRVMQARAVLNNREVVIQEDLEVLSNIFWDSLEHRTKVSAIVISSINQDIADVLSYEEVIESVWSTAMKTGEMLKSKNKLKKILKKLKAHNTNTAKQMRSKVRSYIKRIKDILDQRSTLILIKMKIDKSIVYKVSETSAVLWTPEQLRRVGFKFRRKYQYWYFNGNVKTVKKRVYEAYQCKVKARDMF